MILGSRLSAVNATRHKKIHIFLTNEGFADIIWCSTYALFYEIMFSRIPTNKTAMRAFPFETGLDSLLCCPGALDIPDQKVHDPSTIPWSRNF
eukprot:1846347-Pleurochrysis_carterae.AAC.1